VAAGFGLLTNPNAAPRTQQIPSARAAAPQPPVPLASVAPRIRERFGIFRRASLVGRMPSETRSMITQPGSHTEELDPRLGRGVVTTLAPGPIWLVPGRDQLCLFVPDAAGIGGGCQRTRYATRGFLVVTTYRNSRLQGDALVVGVAPDEVSAVAIEDGQVLRRVPVTRNIYLARAHQLGVVIIPRRPRGATVCAERCRWSPRVPPVLEGALN
jgi:hypothetical protein